MTELTLRNSGDFGPYVEWVAADAKGGEFVTRVRYSMGGEFDTSESNGEVVPTGELVVETADSYGWCLTSFSEAVIPGADDSEIDELACAAPGWASSVKRAAEMLPPRATVFPYGFWVN